MLYICVVLSLQKAHADTSRMCTFPFGVTAFQGSLVQDAYLVQGQLLAILLSLQSCSMRVPLLIAADDAECTCMSWQGNCLSVP